MTFSQLIFIPAITGSDMTSRIFGVGKRLFSRSLQKVILFRLSFVLVPNQTKYRWPGNQVMAVRFGGQGTNSLTAMQYDTFSKKIVSASSFVRKERKLPTESAIKLHFCRKYYLVLMWSQFLTS